MGCFVAKGFLKTILEVLPAAVLRLTNHFDFDATAHKALAEAVDQLRKHEESGKAFYGIPYEKIRVWADFPLRDKRVKPLTQRKVVKTFRLNPLAVESLRRVAKQKGCTETEVLETLLLSA
jgi:hypothetical protein